jgi:hypothetical protein
LPVIAVAGTALAARGYPFVQDSKEPGVCRHARADGGASVAFDPGALAESYSRFKSDLGRKIEVSIAKAKQTLDVPIDVGLPTCRFSSVKTRGLPFVIPAEFRGKKLLFITADDRAEAGRLAELHKDAIVLVTKTRRIGDLADITSRPMSIATLELAKSLGITCVPTLVSIAPEGDRIDLREGR